MNTVHSCQSGRTAACGTSRPEACGVALLACLTYLQGTDIVLAGALARARRSVALGVHVVGMQPAMQPHQPRSQICCLIAACCGAVSCVCPSDAAAVLPKFAVREQAPHSRSHAERGATTQLQNGLVEQRVRNVCLLPPDSQELLWAAEPIRGRATLAEWPGAHTGETQSGAPFASLHQRPCVGSCRCITCKPFVGVLCLAELV